MQIRYELVEEFRLNSDVTQDIQQLLDASFPNCGFNTRPYFKQLPPRRLLGWDGESLVAQMGVEHRAINLAGQPAVIFGVIDLCVRADRRGAGVASGMLRHLESLGREHEIGFIILFADDDRLYSRNGFRRPGNRLVWTKIDEHRTLGIGNDVLDELMIKEIGSRTWPDGPIDLLGYQF